MNLLLTGVQKWVFLPSNCEVLNTSSQNVFEVFKKNRKMLTLLWFSLFTYFLKVFPFLFHKPQKFVNLPPFYVVVGVFYVRYSIGNSTGQ